MRPYALVLVAAVAACSSPERPWDGEPNDTMDTATPLAAGTPVSGTFSPEQDVDFYVFTVPEGGRWVHLQTSDPDAAGCDRARTMVELLAADGTRIAMGYDLVPAPCVDMMWWEPAGTYYVRITHLDDPGDLDYGLLLTLTNGTEGTAVEVEPNDSFDTASGPYATDAVVAATVSTLYNEDFYAISNTSGSWRTVSLASFVGAVGYCPVSEVSMDLFTRDWGTVWAENAEWLHGCERVIYTIPPGTTYYLRILPSNDPFIETMFPYLVEIDFR